MISTMQPAPLAMRHHRCYIAPMQHVSIEIDRGDGWGLRLIGRMAITREALADVVARFATVGFPHRGLIDGEIVCTAHRPLGANAAVVTMADEVQPPISPKPPASISAERERPPARGR